MSERSPEAVALLAEIAAATRLREGPEGVLAVLRAVVRGNAPRLREVAREARLPLPVATAVRRELEQAGLLARGHGMTLTEAGRTLVEQGLRLVAAPSTRCSACAGTGIALPCPELIAPLALLLEAQPATDVTLDQAPCLPETALRRAALMAEAGALEGRRVLILGDDDSVSVALCLLQRHLTGAAPAVPVTVLEIDPRRVAFLRAIADAERLPIALVEHDLRAPLPEALRGRFELFETDPPYTLPGAELFLTRAREALGPPGGLGFLSFAQQAPRAQRDLLALLVRLGFAVTAIRPRFNEYQGAAVLGSTGQLIELAALEPAGEAAAAWTGPLYSAELNPRERRYRCTGCGAILSLGRSDVPATIEALKAAGCPRCGATRFARLAGHPETGRTRNPPC